MRALRDIQALREARDWETPYYNKKAREWVDKTFSLKDAPPDEFIQRVLDKIELGEGVLLAIKSLASNWLPAKARLARKIGRIALKKGYRSKDPYFWPAVEKYAQELEQEANIEQSRHGIKELLDALDEYETTYYFFSKAKKSGDRNKVRGIGKELKALKKVITNYQER